MWIDNTASEDQLRTWLKHTPAMKLVSTLDGQILWANAAFCEWSQYTLNELRRLTWMEISVPDKNLEADIDETKHLDAYNPTYQVKKQYIPKGSKPEWGQLTVMRYPLHGEIECCLCTWEPLRNGTATAFAMAMEHAKKIDQRIEAMTTEMKLLTTQSDEDKFVLSVIRMIQRHPKVAAGFLIIALSVFGLNNIVELLQRTGLVQLPTKEEKGETRAAIANEIGFVALSAEYEIETPKGRVVKVAKYDDGRFGPMSTVPRRAGFDWNADRRFTGSIASTHGADGGSDGRVIALPSGEPGTTF